MSIEVEDQCARCNCAARLKAREPSSESGFAPKEAEFCPASAEAWSALGRFYPEKEVFDRVVKQARRSRWLAPCESLLPNAQAHGVDALLGPVPDVEDGELSQRGVGLERTPEGPHLQRERSGFPVDRGGTAVDLTHLCNLLMRGGSVVERSVCQEAKGLLGDRVAGRVVVETHPLMRDFDSQPVLMKPERQTPSQQIFGERQEDRLLERVERVFERTEHDGRRRTVEASGPGWTRNVDVSLTPNHRSMGQT